MKCKVCGDDFGDEKYNGMCPDCFEHADCCGLEKL